jgi:hypothetical protein
VATVRRGGGVCVESKSLIAQLGDNVQEVLQKALKCTTREEMIELAQEYSIALSEAQVDELLGHIHPDRDRLSDSELEAVTGGAVKPTCPNCDTNLGVIWEIEWVCLFCGEPVETRGDWW